ncbi:hypothetical protein SEVIR_6G005367v4 [Setaria viridis]
MLIQDACCRVALQRWWKMLMGLAEHDSHHHHRVAESFSTENGAKLPHQATTADSSVLTATAVLSGAQPLPVRQSPPPPPPPGVPSPIHSQPPRRLPAASNSNPSSPPVVRSSPLLPLRSLPAVPLPDLPDLA